MNMPCMQQMWAISVIKLPFAFSLLRSKKCTRQHTETHLTSKIVNSWGLSLFYRVHWKIFNRHTLFLFPSLCLSLWKTHSSPSPQVLDYTLIHKVSIRQNTHTHTHIKKHSSKSSNAAEIFSPSPPIQGCFYGNKLQFLALKSGNLQEVWAASRGQTRGWLERLVVEQGLKYPQV